MYPVPSHSFLEKSDEVIINKNLSFVILFFIVDLLPNKRTAGFGSRLLSAASYFLLFLINLKKEFLISRSVSREIVRVIVEFHCLRLHVTFHVDLNELLID